MREVLDKTDCERNSYGWFRVRAFYYLTASLIDNKKAYGEACELAEQAIREYPNYVEFFCLYGIAMYQREQFENALTAFKNAEKLAAEGKMGGLSIHHVEELCNYLVLTYMKLGKSGDALRYAASYLRSYKQHETMLTFYMRILRSKENPENTVKFLSEIYDYENVSDKTLLLRCAKGMGDAALTQLFSNL